MTTDVVIQPTIENTSLLAVIARAASDPNVDVDKMERLLAMQERVFERQAKMAFTEAKLAMRPELPSINMRGRIVIRDKNDPNNILQETPFARFEDIHAEIMPIITKYGFDLSFKNGLGPDGKVRVTTILAHKDGHSEETYFDLPHDSSGSKNVVQAVGSSTAYAKRYGMVSILNIRVSGEDDNGVAAGEKACLSKEHREKILADLDELKADKRAFAEYMGVDSISDILETDYDKACAAIASKRKRSGK